MAPAPVAAESLQPTVDPKEQLVKEKLDMLFDDDSKPPLNFALRCDPNPANPVRVVIAEGGEVGTLSKSFTGPDYTYFVEYTLRKSSENDEEYRYSAKQKNGDFTINSEQVAEVIIDRQKLHTEVCMNSPCQPMMYDLYTSCRKVSDPTVELSQLKKQRKEALAFLTRLHEKERKDEEDAKKALIKNQKI